jgi:hypothetical protein
MIEDHAPRGPHAAYSGRAFRERRRWQLLRGYFTALDPAIPGLSPFAVLSVVIYVLCWKLILIYLGNYPISVLARFWADDSHFSLTLPRVAKMVNILFMAYVLMSMFSSRPLGTERRTYRWLFFVVALVLLGVLHLGFLLVDDAVAYWWTTSGLVP